MAVAKLKQPPIDPSREALVQALADLAEAQKALDRHEKATRQMWRTMRECEDAIARATTGAEQAVIAEGFALADASVGDPDDPPPPTGDTLRLAQQSVADCENRLAATKRARDALRRSKPDVEQHVRDCEGRVEAAISLIEAPAIAQATAALQAFIVQAEPLRRLLFDVSATYNSREIGWPGADAAKAEVEAAGQIALRTYTSDADPTKGAWAKRRAMLRQDPYVVLPDLAALPASPQPPSAA
jgi:hypothetical protein